jgi:peroxiredoxin Q/BCP
MLNVGDKAPDIRVHTDTDEDFRLSELKGKRVVLYFYPKADTPGCTVEACEFRDGIKAIARKGAAVIGISPDKPAAQARFKQKYDLPFTLLADEERTAAQAYGVWKEKNMYGRTARSRRSTRK